MVDTDFREDLYLLINEPYTDSCGLPAPAVVGDDDLLFDWLREANVNQYVLWFRHRDDSQLYNWDSLRFFQFLIARAGPYRSLIRVGIASVSGLAPARIRLEESHARARGVEWQHSDASKIVGIAHEISNLDDPFAAVGGTEERSLAYTQECGVLCSRDALVVSPADILRTVPLDKWCCKDPHVIDSVPAPFTTALIEAGHTLVLFWSDARYNHFARLLTRDSIGTLLYQSLSRAGIRTTRVNTLEGISGVQPGW